MKTRMQIHNPDTVELELSITMTVGDWKRFNEQIGTTDDIIAYPLRNVRNHIREAVSQLSERVEQEAEME